MKKIVVLGGSFNPPTKAHKTIMEEAIKSINADIGIYLPADISYLSHSRKDVKTNEILPNEERSKMLLSMHDSNPKIIIEDYEFITHHRSHTYESLKYIQSKYPQDEIYFITGSDKLNVISRWHSSDNLLKEFKFLVVAREDDDINEIIENNEKLKKYKNQFFKFSIPDEYLSISSTEVRRAIRKKDYETLKVHLTKSVKELYIEFIDKSKN